MRVLILLFLIAACANQPKATEPQPVQEEKVRVLEVPEAEKPPRKKPLPQKPTVIVVPTPPPICPPPAKTDKQQILQDMNCLYQIEKDRIEKAKPK